MIKGGIHKTASRPGPRRLRSASARLVAEHRFAGSTAEVLRRLLIELDPKVRDAVFHLRRTTAGASPPSAAARSSAIRGHGARLSRARLGHEVRRFWQIVMDANITGQSAMVAYNILLAIVPIALLALFIAGQILSSPAAQRSMLTDLRSVFPGATEHTLNSLLHQIQSSTTSTGVLALVASLWLGSSLWGSLDTAFSRVYGCPSRRWLEQKRFAITMLGVVLLFMLATVAVPTVQSILKAGARTLPLDLARVNDAIYAISLLGGLALLFFCLSVIYARVPNRPVPWRAVWPGALGATLAIGAIDYAFPAYLSNISTIARFGTTIVFIILTLGWFYVLALIVLSGAIVNALRLGVDLAEPADPSPGEGHPRALAPRSG